MKRFFIIVLFSLLWVSPLFSLSRREIYLDLQYFLDSLRTKAERLRVIYQEEPEFSKEEKIQQAKREYAFSILQWEKAKGLCTFHKDTYRDNPRFRLLEQDIEQTFSELKSRAFQITKLHSLDLYARSNNLKPGKLLQFRKFRSVKTGAMKEGEELIQILKKVYLQYNLRSRVSLQQALETINPVVDEFPDFLPGFFWQARIYFELEQIEEAQRVMHHLLDVDPNLTIAKSIDERMLSEDDLLDYSFDNTKIQNLPHEISPVDLSQKPPEPQKLLPPGAIRRVPYVVVVGNSTVERPQTGLNEAQMVFELPVEEGNTRLLALYGQEAPAISVVGPVRSLRDYFIDLLYFLDPLLLHCGASPGGLKRIKELEFHTFDEMMVYSAFFRDPQRVPPNNLYTSLDKLVEPGYARRKIRGDVTDWLRTTQVGYPYHENIVKNVHVPFYRNYQVTWQMSEEHGMYERYINGVLQKDARTGEPIRARNLIIQMVNESPPMDEEGRINLELTGKGEMHAFVKGKPFKGTWHKPDIYAPIRYIDESGGEIAFFSGNIWVHLISKDQKIRVDKNPEKP